MYIAETSAFLRIDHQQDEPLSLQHRRDMIMLRCDAQEQCDALHDLHALLEKAGDSSSLRDLLGGAAQVVGAELHSGNVEQARLCAMRIQPSLAVMLELERSGCHLDPDPAEPEGSEAAAGGHAAEEDPDPTGTLNTALLQLASLSDCGGVQLEALTRSVRRSLGDPRCDVDAVWRGSTPLLRSLDIPGDHGSDTALLLLSQGADPTRGDLCLEGSLPSALEVALAALELRSTVTGDSVEVDAMMRTCLGLLGCGGMPEEAGRRGQLLDMAIRCGQSVLLEVRPLQQRQFQPHF